MNPHLPTSVPAAPTPSRRAVTGAAIWSVPAITLASAAPAFAASNTFEIEPNSPATRTLARCGPAATGTFSVTVRSTRAISDTDPADLVAFSLPLGLTWGVPANPLLGDSDRVRHVHPPLTPVGSGGVASAVVHAPLFHATGTAGAYSMASTFRGELAHETLWITISSGTMRRFVREAAVRTQSNVTFTFPAQPVTGAQDAWVSGDQTASSAGFNRAVVTGTGTVLVSGPGYDNAGDTATNAQGFQIQWRASTNASNSVTDITQVHTWSSVAWDTTLAGSATVGGIATRAATAGSTGTATGVWIWFRDPAATSGSSTATTNSRRRLRVAKVNGLPAGTVQGAWAHAGTGYVHIQGSGVYQFPTFAPPANTSTSAIATNTTVDATLMTGTAGATLTSTWGHHRRDVESGGVSNTAVVTYGGAALVGSTLRTWNRKGSTTATSGTTNSTSTTAGTVAFAPTTATTSVALDPSIGTVLKLYATDSGVALLNAKHEIWTYGSNAVGTTGTRTWVRLASAISDFHAWGYHTDYRYLGGAWITLDGEAVQFLVAGSTTTSPVMFSGTPIAGIRRLETSDGTYLALKWDGTLYGWNGNLDNEGRSPATQLTNPVTTGTVDIGVWGFHHNLAETYMGGGYILTSGACTVPTA